MLLYIIRHGDPDYATDSLTEKGIEQAYALAKRLAVHGLDEIYTSPMGRARQTAQPTCELLGVEACVEDWMSERLAWDDLSVLNEAGNRDWSFNCQNTYLLDEDKVSRKDWHNLDAFTNCGTAKSGYERISQASDIFLHKLGYVREGNVYKMSAPSEKRVAAFCHHGFGMTWLSHLLSVPPQVFWAGFNITHSGVTILDFASNSDGYTAPRCLCLSDISHIYKENLPLQYINIINI